ncbi:MAG: hypothetical protein E7096_02875 [Bacteroides sp.]|nr:hypothetical protein [Bacteroides sp.]
MEECIWQRIEEMDTPGFFVTAEIGRRGGDFPDGIEAFIELKMNRIRAGLSARRFLYQEGGWQIYVTFFPTDRVVTERYALKNKVLARGYR